MILVLWFCLRYVFARPEHSSRWNALVTWFAFTAILLFSLTVKRENILLVAVLPVIVFLVQFANKSSDRSSLRRSWWIVLSAALGLIFSLQMRILQTMSSETALLKKFPLTFAELIRLSAHILALVLHCSNGTGARSFSCLIGAVVAWRRKLLNSSARVVCCLCASLRISYPQLL